MRLSRFIGAVYRRIVFLFTIRLFLARCGSGSVVVSPIFITPECVEIGSRVYIWTGGRIEGVWQYGDKKYNPTIKIGNNVIIQQFCHITAASELVIGSDTLISFNVSIQDTDHIYSDISIPVFDQGLIVRKTMIGQKCFIGAGVKILAGTILGDNCIVGANSVVRGVFPAGCVITGAPATVIKKFDENSNLWLSVK